MFEEPIEIRYKTITTPIASKLDKIKLKTEQIASHKRNTKTSVLYPPSVTPDPRDEVRERKIEEWMCSNTRI